MNFKIVKNLAGKIVASGPNVDAFEPEVPPGGSIELSDRQVMKVVRNASGSIVATGPDIEEFQPMLPAGGSIELLYESDLAALLEPSPETVKQETVDALSQVVQKMLDDQAVALGYDDIRSAVSYAGESAVPKFQSEGRALRAWRSLVWASCYATMEEVLAGKAEVPTAEALIAGLPAFQLGA